MGYHLVTVNPLKPFPIASFGLANVMSLKDVENAILKKYKEMAQEKIDADDARAASGSKRLNTTGHTEIFLDFEKLAYSEFEKFKEERWPKIELVLKVHLARQERRMAHFKSACRFAGCNNLRRQKRGSGGERGTKAQRPIIKPLFCGVHIGLRKQLTREMLDALHA